MYAYYYKSVKYFGLSNLGILKHNKCFHIIFRVTKKIKIFFAKKPLVYCVASLGWNSFSVVISFNDNENQTRSKHSSFQFGRSVIVAQDRVKGTLRWEGICPVPNLIGALKAV